MRGSCLAVAVAAVLALAVVPAAAAWSWPVGGPVLEPFAVGNDPYAAGQHRGVDIGAAAGETVRAPVGGRVSFAGTLPRYGHTVTIRADGVAVTLLHLGALAVTRGADVTEGQPLALAGPTGDVEQQTPYVHLGVRRADDDNGYLDPLGFLPSRAAPSEPEPQPAPAQPASDPAPVAPVAAAPAPEPALPAVAPAEPAPAASTAVAVAPALPADVPTVPPVEPAVAAEPLAAASGRAAVGPARETEPRHAAHRGAPRTYRGLPRRMSRPTATADVRVHAAHPRTLAVQAEAQWHSVRAPEERRRAGYGDQPVASGPGRFTARADAPAAPPAGELAGGGTGRRARVLVAVALAVLAALVALAAAWRRRPRAAVPTATAPCPLGRRAVGARLCGARVMARTVARRPAVRSRAGPRVAAPERVHVLA